MSSSLVYAARTETIAGVDGLKSKAEKQRELLKRAQDGDIDAFAELFEEQRRFVYSLACRLAGSNDCDDVVMETFLKAWKSLPGFRGRSTLKTWLAIIARNCSLDFRRRSGRQAAREITIVNDQGDSGLGQLADPHFSNPSVDAVNLETKKIIETAMAELKEEQRITVVLREIDGLSYREIAAATNVGIGTVMSRLFYGKRKLRELLLEFFNE